MAFSVGLSQTVLGSHDDLALEPGQRDGLTRLVDQRDVLRLVLGGEASDVPERIEIAATRAGDAVHAEFKPQSYARLAQPSEVCLDRSVVLCESNGTARVTGSINGEDIDFVGDGVFELLHG